MKHFLSILLLFCLLQATSQTNCDTLVNKVLMVGDSWSNFPVGFGSFENNLDRFGYTNVGMVSNTTNLSVNGAITSDFLSPAGILAIQTALINNPSIEIVNLSIGGNDMLDNWNNSMDSVTTDSLLDATMARVEKIIDTIQSLKPGVIIYLTGYDFANFEEVIQTFLIPTSHPFYGRWDGMGKPNFIELNTLLTRASDKFEILANTNPTVHYSSALGLMQYLYGQTSPLGVAPSGTYAPKSVAFPGGRLDYPTPKIRMNDYVVFLDCFHLDNEGFDQFYRFHFEQFYFNYFRGNKDVILLSEGGNKDGTITSNSGLNASNVAIGNSTSNGISKGIISFNTSSVPAGTNLIGGNIFLYRDNQTGTLPSFNKVILAVKKGSFGTSTSLDFSDYNSAADKIDTACTYGTVSEDGFWLRISIPLDLLSEINSAGTTQFRISMIDSTDGNTLFFSTGDSTNKPILDLEFESTVSMIENRELSNVTLFPNPTSLDIITIGNLGNFIGNAKIIDITGRTFPVEISHNQLTIYALESGTYFLILTSKNERITKKFIKL